MLVKKEVRLLFPSWALAIVLATVQCFTRPYDFYVAILLFFGLTIMALTTIGREVSLNAFSSLLAQPAERLRIWTVKLSVLALAFATVCLVWLVAFFSACLRSGGDVLHQHGSYELVIAICLIAAATFTGGLWTTLLLRQVAGAFWLTLLVPVTLSGLSGIFLADSESDSLFIAILSTAIGVYSLAGFLFARRLFFRAQDSGWSGGVINLPQWSFLFAGVGSRAVIRKRQPLTGLIKKEILLQQGVLTGAAFLFVLHASVIVLRVIHKFSDDSLGLALTSYVWIFWLMLPVLIGSLAVAEERRLGVMEGQLCLPVSRRRQFIAKAGLTLLLGTFLGGVLPVILESIGLTLGAPGDAFMSNHHPLDRWGVLGFLAATTVAAGVLTLICFFASSLVKSFLPAVGLGLVGSVALGFLAPAGLVRLCSWFIPMPVVPILVTVFVLVVTVFWLTYLNFVRFREGWLLWRRHLIGFLCATILVCFGSTAVYYRAWEGLLPTEPAHSPARLSLAQPPTFDQETTDNLLVRLPDGRVWFDHLSSRPTVGGLVGTLALAFNPLPHSAGPARYLAGTNWTKVSARYLDAIFPNGPHNQARLEGYTETVGLQADGTLWASQKSDPQQWTADQPQPLDRESGWRQLAVNRDFTSVLLLKQDGTLWRWGTNGFAFGDWPGNWPGLSAFQPRRLGADADWAKIYSTPGSGFFARKTDGSFWQVGSETNGVGQVRRVPNDYYGAFLAAKYTSGAMWGGSFVSTNGTWWVMFNSQPNRVFVGTPALQIGTETDWVAVANQGPLLVALKADGTLWLPVDYSKPNWINQPPVRLGTHHDWVAVTAVNEGVVSLAADGSLWLWPNPFGYLQSELVLALPKGPQFIANIFEPAN